MKKIKNEKGKIAVIYSSLCGWSSIAHSKKDKQKMLFDYTLVKMMVDNLSNEEILKYIRSNYSKLFSNYTDSTLYSIVIGLKIKWIPKGYEFIVEFNEGTESIQPAFPYEYFKA